MNARLGSDIPPATIPVNYLTPFAIGFSGAVAPGRLLVYRIRESVRDSLRSPWP